MTPRVVVTDKKNINVSVMCPICKGMILRDKTAYIHHMTENHSGDDIDAASWDIVHNLSSRPGLVDEYEHLSMGNVCYGCGSSFNSKAELIAHLDNEHGAA